MGDGPEAAALPEEPVRPQAPHPPTFSLSSMPHPPLPLGRSPLCLAARRSAPTGACPSSAAHAASSPRTHPLPARPPRWSRPRAQAAKDKSWLELDDDELYLATEVLSFNQDKWDAYTMSPSVKWLDLSKEEESAAAGLGFDEAEWDVQVDAAAALDDLEMAGVEEGELPGISSSSLGTHMMKRGPDVPLVLADILEHSCGSGYSVGVTHALLVMSRSSRIHVLTNPTLLVNSLQSCSCLLPKLIVPSRLELARLAGTSFQALDDTGELPKCFGKSLTMLKLLQALCTRRQFVEERAPPQHVQQIELLYFEELLLAKGVGAPPTENAQVRGKLHQERTLQLFEELGGDLDDLEGLHEHPKPHIESAGETRFKLRWLLTWGRSELNLALFMYWLKTKEGGNRPSATLEGIVAAMSSLYGSALRLGPSNGAPLHPLCFWCFP